MKPLHLLLLGGAGYLAYRYFMQSTAGDAPAISTGPYQVKPGDKLPGDVPVDGEGKPLAPVTPAPASQASNLALIKAAASGSEADALKADAAGIALGPDAWNFYRAEATGSPVTTVDLFEAGQRSVPITATEYLRRRAAAGLD